MAEEHQDPAAKYEDVVRNSGNTADRVIRELEQLAAQLDEIARPNRSEIDPAAAPLSAVQWVGLTPVITIIGMLREALHDPVAKHLPSVDEMQQNVTKRNGYVVADLPDYRIRLGLHYNSTNHLRFTGFVERKTDRHTTASMDCGNAIQLSGWFLHQFSRMLTNSSERALVQNIWERLLRYRYPQAL